MKLGAVRISPRQFLLALLKQRKLIGYPQDLKPDNWETTRITVRGRSKKEKISLRYDVTTPPRKDRRMRCAQYGVRIPTSIAALVIGNRMVVERGVLPPEACIDPAHLIDGLRDYGFTIKVSGKPDN
jgi:saccharopine dehydrogenase-like NADP-dependent oxidoreductase